MTCQGGKRKERGWNLLISRPGFHFLYITREGGRYKTKQKFGKIVRFLCVRNANVCVHTQLGGGGDAAYKVITRAENGTFTTPHFLKRDGKRKGKTEGGGGGIENGIFFFPRPPL